ncbi:MAG: 2'-5' RNA ligase family protein [Halobacteriota archaeon]
MFSLNVPVSGRVRRLANDLYPELARFDRVRERHSIVLKRFDDRAFDTGPGVTPDRQVSTFRHRIRPIVAETTPFTVRATGIDAFDVPTTGSAPVVYLAIESDGLRRLHDRLVDAFGAVESLEGSEYTPHVTLARGGARDVAARLLDREFEPIEWRVGAIDIWDPRFREVAGTVSLTA